MPRTTTELVLTILEIDPQLLDLSAFIEPANELVTELLEPIKRPNGTKWHSDIRLELIERWLAAHFLRIRDMTVASEQAGPVNQRFQYKVDLRLNVTLYGQQAMLLDTSGTLLALNDGKHRASVAWLGTAFEEV